MLGPIAFERHRDALRGEVERLENLGGVFRGAEELPDLGGWFLKPGVILGTSAAQATTELFGPLMTMHSYTDERHALLQANDRSGGLDAFVFSEDTDAALDLAGQIRAGEVRVNGTFMTDLADGSQQTFWGTSGIGGHGPQYGVRFFLGNRVVGLDAGTFSL
jgi:phenylacetaldehyde dehydrogenase